MIDTQTPKITTTAREKNRYQKVKQHRCGRDCQKLREYFQDKQIDFEEFVGPVYKHFNEANFDFTQPERIVVNEFHILARKYFEIAMKKENYERHSIVDSVFVNKNNNLNEIYKLMELQKNIKKEKELEQRSEKIKNEINGMNPLVYVCMQSGLLVDLLPLLCKYYENEGFEFISGASLFNYGDQHELQKTASGTPNLKIQILYIVPGSGPRETKIIQDKLDMLSTLGYPITLARFNQELRVPAAVPQDGITIYFEREAIHNGQEGSKQKLLAELKNNQEKINKSLQDKINAYIEQQQQQ